MIGNYKIFNKKRKDKNIPMELFNVDNLKIQFATKEEMEEFFKKYEQGIKKYENKRKFLDNYKLTNFELT
jgi:hypothetical protein